MKKLFFAAVAVSAIGLTSPALCQGVNESLVGVINDSIVADDINASRNSVDVNGNDLNSHNDFSDTIDVSGNNLNSHNDLSESIDVSGNNLLSNNTTSTVRTRLEVADSFNQVSNANTSVDVTEVEVNVDSFNDVGQTTGNTIGSNSGATIATSTYVPLNVAAGVNDLHNLRSISSTAVVT